MRIARWINVADVQVGGGYMRANFVEGFQGERELDEKINGEFLEFEMVKRSLTVRRVKSGYMRVDCVDDSN
jgi:hypothetical protein